MKRTIIFSLTAIIALHTWGQNVDVPTGHGSHQGLDVPCFVEVDNSKEQVNKYIEQNDTTISVRVNTNDPDWLYSGKAKWIKVSQDKKGKRLTFYCRENKSTESRTARFTVSCTGRGKKTNVAVVIRQKGASSYLKIDGSSSHLITRTWEYRSAKHHLTIETNASQYSVSKKGDWLNIQKASDTLWIETKENKSSYDRSGSLTIEADGITTTVNIKQRGIPVYLEIAGETADNNNTIVLGNVQDEGGLYTIDVKTNAPYTVAVNNNSPWVTVESQTKDSIIIKVDRNMSTQPRIGTLAIDAGGLRGVVQFKQTGAPYYLKVADRTEDFIEQMGHPGGKLTYPIETNSENVNVERCPQWVNHSLRVRNEKNGIKELTLQVEVLPSQQTTEREDFIRINASDKRLAITIKQTGVPPAPTKNDTAANQPSAPYYLKVADRTEDFIEQMGHSGGKLTYPIETNAANVNVERCPQWVNHSLRVRNEKNGIKELTLQVEILPSQQTTEREDLIRINASGKRLAITIKQTGVPPAPAKNDTAANSHPDTAGISDKEKHEQNETTPAVAVDRNNSKTDKHTDWNDRWPLYYKNPVGGFQITYAHKNTTEPRLIGYLEVSGAPGGSGRVWAGLSDLSLNGIQIGFHFNPTTKWGLGIQTGIFAEAYYYGLRHDKNEITYTRGDATYTEYYYDYDYYEVDLYAPLDLTLRIPFGRKSALYLRYGIGFDYMLYQNINGVSLTLNGKPQRINGVSQTLDNMDRLNISIEYGFNLRLGGLWITGLYQKGQLLEHPYALNEKYTIGLSFFFGGRK